MPTPINISNMGRKNRSFKAKVNLKRKYANDEKWKNKRWNERKNDERG